MRTTTTSPARRWASVTTAAGSGLRGWNLTVWTPGCTHHQPVLALDRFLSTEATAFDEDLLAAIA